MASRASTEENGHDERMRRADFGAVDESIPRSCASSGINKILGPVRFEARREERDLPLMMARMSWYAGFARMAFTASISSASS